MFSLIDIPYINKLEIEPTTFCNAGCPYCARHVQGTSDQISDLTLEHLPVHLLQKMKEQFDLHQGANTVSIWYCGNYGDSLMHPEFEQLFRYSAENFKSVGVHTNGGGRTTDFWANLGKVCKQNNNASVTFCIDGLEDTNHLYRRKVQWKKIMSNVQSFISNGGYANWKMIVFDHNKHQVDEAKALANSMGFQDFSPEISTRQVLPNKEYKEVSAVAKKKTEIQIQKAKEINETTSDESCISCRGIDEQNMYLNPKGRIWPCCYMSEDYDLTIDRLEKKEPWLAEHYKNNFNNFNIHSLQEIFEAPAWKEITDSWTTRKHELKRCWKSCSNAKWKVSNTVDYFM